MCGNLWKRHVDQLLRRPIDTPPANSPAIQRHFVPNDLTSLVGQPVEIVPDSFSQGIPVPAATAVSDEPHLMDSCEPCFTEGSITSSSCPVQDKDTNERTCSIPVPASIDDVLQLTVQSDSTCEVKSTPTCTGKRYPTRTTRGPPSYLKDYELK